LSDAKEMSRNRVVLQKHGVCRFEENIRAKNFAHVKSEFLKRGRQAIRLKIDRRQTASERFRLADRFAEVIGNLRGLHGVFLTSRLEFAREGLGEQLDAA